MKKLLNGFRQNLCGIGALAAMMLIWFFGAMIATATNDLHIYTASLIFGALGIMLLTYVKEEYLHKTSPGLYIVAVVLLIAQLIVRDKFGYTMSRYLPITETFMFYSAAILPFACFLPARMLTKRQSFGFIELACTVGIMLVPMLLVLMQSNKLPVLIALVAGFIAVLKAKTEGRLKISWGVFVLLSILVAAATFAAIWNPYIASERLEVILTRGGYDPNGAGWMRNLLDEIFAGASFFGAGSYPIENSKNYATMLNALGSHNAAILIAEWGWLPFAAMIAVYLLFFVCLFRMVSKTKQSAFAKYSSLMLAVALAAQTAAALIGLFLLDRSPTDLPFISCSMSINTVNYLMTGVIITLYTQRNRATVLKEAAPKPQGRLAELFKKYITLPEEEEVTIDFFDVHENNDSDDISENNY